MNDQHTRFELTPHPEVASRTADLFTRETQCCSFFTFTLTATGGSLTLDVAGPVVAGRRAGGAVRAGRPTSRAMAADEPTRSARTHHAVHPDGRQHSITKRRCDLPSCGVTAIPSPALVVLVGPSGAGKSTWARQRFAANEIVSSDALRAAVGSGEGDLMPRSTRSRCWTPSSRPGSGGA